MVILLAACRLAYSQTDIDSLIRVAESAQGDSVAIAYINVGHNLCYSNPQRSIPYLEKALTYARQHHDYKCECEALSFLGVANRHLGNYTESLQHFNSQLAVAQQYNVADEIVWAYLNLGNMMIYMKNYPLAIDYLDQALAAADNIDKESVLPYIYVNLGRAHLLSQDYDEALRWHHEALQFRMAHPEEPVNIVASYRDIGNVYMERGWHGDAKRYYYICLNMLDTMPENGIPATININLANIYHKAGNIDSALYCAHEALQCARNYKNKTLIRDACTILGDIYFARRNYSVAEKFYGLQIIYNDSIKTSDISRKIFDIQTMTNQYKQEAEIESLNRYRTRQMYISIVLVVIVLSAIGVAIMLHRKRRHISAMVEELDLQNHQLSSSIVYAKRIQDAIVPGFDKVLPFIRHRFIFTASRETVSGNFYWHHDSQRFGMFAVADTGAIGIPGACLAMLGTSILHEIAETMYDPAAVLSQFRDRVKSVLMGMNKDFVVDPNLMDMELMAIDKLCNMVFYSGIKFPLVCVRDGKVSLLQDNLESDTVATKDFVSDMMSLKPGDVLYIMTHGFASQIGGVDSSPFTRERLYALLGEICSKPMDEQRQILEQTFSDWRGGCERVNDVTIAGFLYNTPNAVND